MAPTTGNKLSRCGRGVLKLTSFKPCPRPGGELKMKFESENQKNRSQMFANSSQTNLPSQEIPKSSSPQGMEKDFEVILAKYSYEANPNMPGGFKELTMKQGEKLYLHGKHNSNPHWIKAENFNGEIGYIPTNYIMELKSKPTSLPWLENRRLEKEYEKEQQQKNQNIGFGVPKPGEVEKPFKPYISAYDTGAAAQASDYSCEVCNKVFNGPQPYKMHMASKAHREEVEYQNSLK